MSRTVKSKVKKEDEIDELKLQLNTIVGQLKALAQPRVNDENQMFIVLKSLRESMQNSNDLFSQTISNCNTELKNINLAIADLRREGMDSVNAMARISSEVTTKLSEFNARICEVEMLPHCSNEEQLIKVKVFEKFKEDEADAKDNKKRVKDLKWSGLQKVIIGIIGIIFTIINIPNFWNVIKGFFRIP
jgi:hypothetical protein